MDTQEKYYSFPVTIDLKTVTDCCLKGDNYKGKRGKLEIFVGEQKFRVTDYDLLEILKNGITEVSVVFKYESFYLQHTGKIKKLKKTQFICGSCNGHGYLGIKEKPGKFCTCQICNGIGIINWVQEIFNPLKVKQV